MKPRASASFCHCPNETSTPSSHVGPSCVAKPDGSRSTTSSAPARPTAPATAGSSSSRGSSPTPDAVAGAQLEAEEVLERPGQPRSPRRRGDRRQVDAVDRDASRRRPVHPGEQLDHRRLAGTVLADDRRRPHRPGAATSTLVERQPVAAGIAERHVLEADALRQPIGRLRRRLLLQRRGVVLQPRQAQRRVEPHAAQEAELARPSGRCTATGAGRRRRRARCRRRCDRGPAPPRRCRRRRRSRTAPTPATSRTPTPPWPWRSGPATARARRAAGRGGRGRCP